MDRVEGYLAGLASYVLVAELALGEVLAGALPRPEFPDALRPAGAGTPAPQRRPRRWRSPMGRRSATTSSPGWAARQGRDRGRPGGARGARRVGAERAGDLIVRRAGLGARMEAIMAAPGDRPFELARAVTAMRAALGISRGD